MLSIYQKLIKVENRAVLADGTKMDHTGTAVARVIVLAPVAATMLRAWRTAQGRGTASVAQAQDHNDLVFTKENGAPLKPDWLNRRFKQLARQASLPDGVRVYDLRHGWATAALRAGVHPKLVQEVMRHSSYSTTADTYTHVMPAHSAEAVRTVAALFERPSRLILPPTAGPQRRRERLVIDQQGRGDRAKRRNHPLQVMPHPRRSAKLPGTPGSRDMQTRTVSAMSETPSLSADERAKLERLRSEVATLRSQVQAGGAKPTRPGAAVGGRQRWRTIAATLCVWVGRRRGTAGLAQGLDLAAGLGQPATGPRPLSGPVGPRRPRGKRLMAPVRSPTAG